VVVSADGAGAVEEAAAGGGDCRLGKSRQRWGGGRGGGIGGRFDRSSGNGSFSDRGGGGSRFSGSNGGGFKSQSNFSNGSSGGFKSSNGVSNGYGAQANGNAGGFKSNYSQGGVTASSLSSIPPPAKF